MTNRVRTLWMMVAAGLVVFILVTSAPVFQALHHHWIFPVLAAILTIEWALAGGWGRVRKPLRFVDPAAARVAILSILAFLILMGVVRHQTILACVDRCSFKLGGAALMAAVVFAIQARRREAHYWNFDRAQLAGLACALWAAHLVLFGLEVSPWKLDVLFGIAAVLLWLSPGRPALKVAALAIPVVLIIRRYCGEHLIIVLNLLMVGIVMGTSRFRVRAAERKY